MAVSTILNDNQKKEIAKARKRLASSSDFMKRLADSKGFDLSLKGKNAIEQIGAYNSAMQINSESAFTKKGYKKWVQEITSDVRMSEKEFEFILSKIDTEKMEFVEDTKLRYGSNPQLDYVFDNAIQVINSMIGNSNDTDTVGRFLSGVSDLTQGAIDFLGDFATFAL